MLQLMALRASCLSVMRFVLFKAVDDDKREELTPSEPTAWHIWWQPLHSSWGSSNSLSCNEGPSDNLMSSSSCCDGGEGWFDMLSMRANISELISKIISSLRHKSLKRNEGKLYSEMVIHFAKHVRVNIKSQNEVVGWSRPNLYTN